jgi:hypothetical protein
VLDFPKFFRLNPKYDKLFEERLLKVVQEGLLPLVLQSPTGFYPQVSTLIDARRQHPDFGWLGLVSIELIRRGITDGIEQELSFSLGVFDISYIENNVTDDIDDYFANQDKYDTAIEATVRIWKDVSTQIFTPNIQILESFVETYTKKLMGMSIVPDQRLFQLRKNHASIILNCTNFAQNTTEIGALNLSRTNISRYIVAKPSLILHWYLNHHFLEHFLKGYPERLEDSLRELAAQSKHSIQILEYTKHMEDVPSLGREFVHIGHLAMMLSKNLPKAYVENFLCYLENQILTFQPSTLNSSSLEKVASIPLLLLDPTVDRIGVLSLDAYESVNYSNFLQLNSSAQHQWLQVQKAILERGYPSSRYKYLKLEEAIVANLLGVKLSRGAAKILQTHGTLKHSTTGIKDLTHIL